MSEQQAPTEEQIAAQRTLWNILFYAGWGFLLFGLYVSAFLIPDIINNLSGPQTITLSEAAEVASSDATYARIENGAWDCETLAYVEGLSASSLAFGRIHEEIDYTEIFYTDNSQDVVVFVTLSGAVDCADIAEDDPSGYLYSMGSGTRQNLTNDARLARYFTTDTFLEFCGYCGQENSMIGGVFGIGAILIGAGMIVYGRRMRKKYPAPDKQT